MPLRFGRETSTVEGTDQFIPIRSYVAGNADQGDNRKRLHEKKADRTRHPGFQVAWAL